MASPKKDLKEDFQKLIERLENMILTGVLQPRERLIEAELAKDLGVSRFRIRDAFKILETKSLIKVIPYKGAMVGDLDEQEIIALAISSEEDDARIYRGFAQRLRGDYPATAKVFDGIDELGPLPPCDPCAEAPVDPAQAAALDWLGDTALLDEPMEQRRAELEASSQSSSTQ